MRLLASTLLRLLFPSWAFFDRAVAVPSLEVRRRPLGRPPGAWVSALRAPTRRWWHLLYNPAGTYTLVAQGQVERLHLALLNDEGELARTATTRALVQEFAEAHRSAIAHSEAGDRWQWRIVSRGPGGEAESVRSEMLG